MKSCLPLVITVASSIVGTVDWISMILLPNTFGTLGFRQSLAVGEIVGPGMAIDALVLLMRFA